MKSHLQKSQRVRQGGQWKTKPPKAKWTKPAPKE